MEEDPPAGTEFEAGETESHSVFEVTAAAAVKGAAANPWLLRITLFDTGALLRIGADAWMDAHQLEIAAKQLGEFHVR